MGFYEIILFSLLFLALGSFSSVLIYRLPLIENNRSLNLISPRSHCINCKNKISFINLLPILGFLLQRGICEHCGKKINLSYLIHEINNVIAGLILLYLHSISYELLFSYFLFFVLYVMIMTDYEKFYLPFSFNICITAIGFISIYFTDLFYIKDYGVIASSQLMLSFYGFFIGFFLLWFINILYKLIKKKDGIGGGDILLLGGFGSIVGPLSLPSIILMGSLFTIFISFLDKDKFKEELPLGSGLILGFFLFQIFKFFELLPQWLVI